MAAHLKATPSSLSFEDGSKQTFSLHNDGTLDVHVTSMTLAGTNHAWFHVKAPTNFTVHKGASHAVEVDFMSGLSHGPALHVTLTVHSNAPDVHVSLSKPAILAQPGHPAPHDPGETPSTGPNQDAPSGDGWGVNSPVAAGGGCFAAGTHVLMADGSTRHIEELCVGDAILAIAERDHTEQEAPAPRTAYIEQLFLHDDGDYALIDIDGIRATPVHRWGVRDGGDEVGFLPTARILSGATALRTYDGHAVAWRPAAAPVPAGSANPVYNFKSSARTYLVGASADGPWYVVHNAKKKDDDEPPTPPSP